MSIQHGELAIGQAFTTGHGLWRCVDVGTRTIVAIRIDVAEVVAVVGGRETQSVVGPCRDASWLTGPPYALGETAFDEYEFASLRPVVERDVMDWKPGQRRRCHLTAQCK